MPRKKRRKRSSTKSSVIPFDSDSPSKRIKIMNPVLSDSNTQTPIRSNSDRQKNGQKNGTSSSIPTLSSQSHSTSTGSVPSLSSSTPSSNSTRHRPHGSAMSIPASKRRSNRRSGALSQQMKASMADSTYGRKRTPIDDLKPNAPYNEQTSFFSECSVDEIFNELTMALKCESDLDLDIHKSCYKIRGRKFIQNTMCEFQIELFRTTSRHCVYPNHILVEFQRRNGDGFVFQQFLQSMFCELRKTKIIAHSKFPESSSSSSSDQHTRNLMLNDNNSNNNNHHQINDEVEEQKQSNHRKQSDSVHTRRGSNASSNDYSSPSSPSSLRYQIDDRTLRMLLDALFDGKGESEMKRTAANYLASNIQSNLDLVDRIVKFEPLIMTKFSDLLLRCMDPQIVRSVGITLFSMLQQSDTVRREAVKLNVKMVCKKTMKRWTEPVEQRYGKNNKYVIRVIPSLQVAQRMSACIEVLE